MQIRTDNSARGVTALALFVLLAWAGCTAPPPPAPAAPAAQSPEEKAFKYNAAMFIDARDRCWGVAKKRDWPETRRIIQGVVSSASKFWGPDVEKWEELFWLVCSETWCENIDNPRDPSYGVGQVTLEAFHATAKHYPEKITLPKGKRAQIKYLRENIERNLDVTAAELYLCETHYPGNYQTMRILCYKLGRLGKFNGKAGKVRKENFWDLRRSYRCVKIRLEKDWNLCPCIWDARRALKRKDVD